MRRRTIFALGVLTAVLLGAPSSQARRSAAAATGDWPTYHHVSTRIGATASGPALGRAHGLWSARVDGDVYAEPLIARGRVIVATENDSVYAFGAANGRLLWRAQLGSPVRGGDLPCGNIDPSGITGTPVIDVRAGTLYTVIFVRPAHHWLVALNLANGAVRWRRSIDPPGASPRVHQERAALARSHGRVYVAYGGLYGDCGNYHGWVVSVSASRPSGGMAAYRVPTGREGGIWAPSGPAIDAAGYVYVTTGNGSASHFDYGNSVIRLTPGLRKVGFFAPRNAGSLNASDTDLGSTGPLLLPGGRVFAIGKSGVGYLLSARHLGGIGHSLSSRGICGSVFGGLAYSGGVIFMPCDSGLVAVRAAAGLRRIWRNGSADQPPIVAGRGVWAIGGDTLYQFDARNGRVRFRTTIGSTAHFATPSAAGGRIYAAAGARVYAFG